jgi:putative nucleotidyltransferase with HDIG domain
MPAVTKFGKRDRPGHSPLREIYENLRSQLSWPDLLVGLLATLLLSGLLVGFHLHSVPEYQVGDIAAQEVRAPQDITYEDKAGTAAEREMARELTAVLYDFDGALIARIERDVIQAFAAARNILAEKRVPPRGSLTQKQKAEVLAELEGSLGQSVSPSVMPLLLEQRFSASLEGRIIRVLDRVLRGCIVDDQAWPQFLRDQRKGIVVRDNTTLAERPLAEAYMARNRTAAREYLRQFHLEFADLSSSARSRLLNFMDNLLVPNLFYNQAETDARRNAAASRVLPFEIHIKQGKTIVRSGEEVSPAVLAQLDALRNLQKPRSLPGQFFGFCFIIAIFLFGLWRYFVFYQKRHRDLRRQILLILLVLIAQFAVVRLLTALATVLGERVSIEAFRGPFNLHYVIPFAFGAVLVALLADVNLGIITSMLVAALTGLFYGDPYMAAYAVLGSLAGISAVRQYKDRATIMKAGITIGLVNTVAILGIDFLRESPLSFSSIIPRAGFGFAGGILASAMTSLLLPTLESLFKITTDIRLLELSNLNTKVLRDLQDKAPGTYHHSLEVGTLAEAAAEAIGANSLLVRVGAYYHDIGKIRKPEYFVENQDTYVNKHDTLSPNMSCLIIASHVKDGLEVANEIGLPQDISDLIPQHHGTRILSFFYRKALDSMNGKSQDINEEDYRYPGPKPRTKEAAILMITDAVDGASRTLPQQPSPAQIQGMIDRLADAILADNQFDECDITLREIGLIKEAIFKILTGRYHRRIDYPGYDFKTVQEKPDKIPVPNSGSKHAKAM